MSWEYALEGPKKDKRSGTYYYILPAGESVYHGTYSDVTKQDIRSRPNFFADKEAAYSYSEQCKENAPDETPCLYGFKTKISLRLLAMDDCRTVKVLRNLPIMRGTKFSEGFSCGSKSTRPIRHSHRDIDGTFVHKFCRVQGFDGYAARDLRSSDGGSFHAEMYLCNTAKSLSVGRKLRYGVCKS